MVVGIPGCFGFSERFDLDPSVCSTDHSTHGDHQYIQEPMQCGSFETRIFSCRKDACESKERLFFYPVRSNSLALSLSPPPHEDAIALGLMCLSWK